MSKQLLLGDEAIAQAALDAGLSGVYAYPGTPSTEITEYIQMAPITTEQNIHNRWCANEKTAMEAALGISLYEARRYECSCRLFCQLCHHRRERWIDRDSSRRPQYALFAERTRQPFLRRFLTDSHVRTQQSAGSV